MDEQQRTWTSEEAMCNLESLTRLQWSHDALPEGVRELLQTYEAAIPQLAAEIRRLREADPEAAGVRAAAEPEELADLARRLGMDLG